MGQMLPLFITFLLLFSSRSLLVGKYENKKSLSELLWKTEDWGQLSMELCDFNPAFLTKTSAKTYHGFRILKKVTCRLLTILLQMHPFSNLFIIIIIFLSSPISFSRGLRLPTV